MPKINRTSRPPVSELLGVKFPVPDIAAPRLMDYIQPSLTDAEKIAMAKRNERRLDRELNRLKALRGL